MRQNGSSVLHGQLKREGGDGGESQEQRGRGKKCFKKKREREEKESIGINDEEGCERHRGEESR